MYNSDAGLNGFEEPCSLVMDLTAMHDALGVSAEDRLSVKDIRSLCQNILHISVGPDEVQRAVQKVTGDSVGLFCYAGKLLDTLLEIERDRVASEDLYWDFQMLNAGRLYLLECPYVPETQTTLRETPPPVFCPYLGSQGQGYREQGIQDVEEQRLKRRLYLWRLKKDARNACRRMSEARLHTVLPSLCNGRGGVVEAESAGSRQMTPPCTDPLQDMEEKYAVLRRKLFTEMLQEHYGVASWQALLPWQQEERKEELEALAEEVLCAADELALCELPGAFRRYRSSGQVLLRRCPEEAHAGELEWTAALSLRELQRSRQREIGALAFLMRSLDVTGLRSLSLHVRLATMRAEREKHSHAAALAASLSWDKWPEVGMSHCEDLARFWLAEESPWAICGESVTTSSCSQQAVLQHMLTGHERERWFLVDLLHSVTLEELAGEEELHSSDAENVLEGLAILRLACITWVRKTRAVLKARSWGDSALCLLIHLTELQEAEVRDVLWGLLHTNKDIFQSLQEKYRVELRDQKLTNLHRLLLPDRWAPQTASEVTGSTALRPELHRGEDQENFPGREESRHGADRGDVCNAYGNTPIPEEVPYLEVICATNTNSGSAGGTDSDGVITSRCPIVTDLEKGVSVIAVAWSRPTEKTCKPQTPDEAPVESEAGTRIKDEEVRNDLLTHEAPEGAPAEETPDPMFFQYSPHAGCLQQQTLEADGAIAAETLMPLESEVTHDTDDNDDADQTTEEGSCSSRSQSAACRHPEDLRVHLQQDCIQREMTVVHISEMEKETTMKNLVDIKRKVESKYQRDKQRQILRFQERLSIVQNRKSDEDLLGHKQGDDLRQLTEKLKKEDRNQQKTLVKEKLEELRRERSYVMQSKRDRNTAGFKELLGPVVMKRAELEESYPV